MALGYTDFTAFTVLVALSELGDVAVASCWLSELAGGGVVLTWRPFLSLHLPSLVEGLPHHGSPLMFSTCSQHATPPETS